MLCSCAQMTVAREQFKSHLKTHLFQIVWPGWTSHIAWKKGCFEFLELLVRLIFAFSLAGAMNRPRANDNNYQCIYIYIGIYIYIFMYVRIWNIVTCSCVKKTPSHDRVVNWSLSVKQPGTLHPHCHHELFHRMKRPHTVPSMECHMHVFYGYIKDLEIVMAALVDGERMQRSMGCEKAWWSNNLSIISHNGKNSWTKTTCSNWIVWPHGQIQIDNTASKRRRFIWEHPALTTNRSIDGNVMIQSRNQANVCLTWQIGYVHSWT